MSVTASPAFPQDHDHGSALPHNIPDFCSVPGATVIPSGSTTTWTGTQSHGCVGVRGTLVLSGQLTADVIMVYEGGFLDVQSGASIVVRNTSINLTADPRQWGQGLIVFGRIRTNGVAKTRFVRSGGEPLAGQNAITLATAPSGWAVGDELFIPDTRQVPVNDWFNPSFALRHEYRTIAAINGATVTLSAPLTHDHRGARDANGALTVLQDGTRLLPHVANLSCSITIRSASPSGTRGHTAYSGRASVELRNTCFRDLGRTTTDATFDQDSSPNQIGRYPLHIHMLQGPVNPTNTGYQFTVTGNVIRDTRKWPLAIHASSYGLIEGNVIVGGSQLSGAGIALENGQEVENVIRANFVADIRGHENARNTGSAVGPGAGNSPAGPSDGRHAGAGGECVWTVGFYNRFVDNVVTGCRNSAQQIVAGVGFKFFLPPAPNDTRVLQPTTRGADVAQYVERVAQNLPLLQFDNNEAYGLMADGITIWQLGTDGYGWNANQAESVIRNFRIWHTYESGVWSYPVNRLTLDGLVFRHDASVGRPSAMMSGDYRNVNFTVRGGDIHADTVLGQTLDLVGVTRFENVRATTYNHALTFQTPATPGTQASRPASGTTVVVTNPQITPWPGQPLRTIRMRHTTEWANSHTSQPYVVTVTEGSSTFRVCFLEQATQNLYGGTCSGSASRPDIAGLISGNAPPPPPPPPPTEVCGDKIDNDGDGQIDEGCPTEPPPDDTSGGTSGGSTGGSTPPPSSEEGPWAAGDFDGDGQADLGLFRPSTATWYLVSSNGGFKNGVTTVWGVSTDLPVVGDYDGDLKLDVAVYRPANGAWHIRTSSSNFSSAISFALGVSTDVPVPADYDGDGRTDVAVFRPSNGRWYIRRSSSNFTQVTESAWGTHGDVPAPADYDGDGRADLSVYRTNNRTWYIQRSTDGRAFSFRFGTSNDIPVPADYDGDGKADMALYSRAVSGWTVRMAATSFRTELFRASGRKGDVPVTLDVDGDGKTDFVAFHPQTGGWYVLTSPAPFQNGVLLSTWGQAGDVPLPDRSRRD